MTLFCHLPSNSHSSPGIFAGHFVLNTIWRWKTLNWATIPRQWWSMFLCFYDLYPQTLRLMTYPRFVRWWHQSNASLTCCSRDISGCKMLTSEKQCNSVQISREFYWNFLATCRCNGQGKCKPPFPNSSNVKCTESWTSVRYLPSGQCAPVVC